MRRLLVISDIHIGSIFSYKSYFVSLLENELAKPEQDRYNLIILNGDIFDISIAPVDYNIMYLLSKFKRVVYIRGNHDFDIAHYIINVSVCDSYQIDDILIAHGSEYDYLVDKSVNKKATYIRYLFEKYTNICVKKIVNTLFGWWLKIHYRRGHDKAIKEFPEYRVILGHSHIPANRGKYYNTGCMVDGIITYMELLEQEDGSYNIKLIEDRNDGKIRL